VLEIDVDGRDEFLAIEEAADSDFDAVDAALELEDLDLLGKSLFVGFEHTDHVIAVFFLADEEAALHVLRFPARFNDVPVGVFLDELNGRIEGIEFLVGNDRDASFFKLFLAKRTIVFEIVSVWCTAYDGFAAGAEGLGFGALAEGIVEDDDVGPLGVFFPVQGLGYEAFGDVALFFVVNVVADFVTFLSDLPGDISDEAGERNKEKFSFVHELGPSLRTKGWKVL